MHDVIYQRKNIFYSPPFPSSSSSSIYGTVAATKEEKRVPRSHRFCPIFLRGPMQQSSPFLLGSREYEENSRKILQSPPFPIYVGEETATPLFSGSWTKGRRRKNRPSSIFSFFLLSGAVAATATRV